MIKTKTKIDECYSVLEKTQSNVVWEILRQSEPFYEWNHYPEGDVYDKDTHSQYYFHTHAQEDGQRFPEHGHFHLFLRDKGMPTQCSPKSLLSVQDDGSETDTLSHLIAISMDDYGKPMRLFTVNRWVTGETWYSAEDVCHMLPLFTITHAWPSWPTNIWLTEIVRQYQSEIKQLIHKRDQVIEQWQREHPDQNVYEDRRLEITSFLDLA